MKTKKKTSIQAKTLFFLLTYNIVIILLLWVCQIKILDIYYEKEQVDNMNNIVKSLNSTDSSNLTSTLQDIAYENDVCIVLSDDISVVGAYNINMNGCILKNNNSKVRELMYNFVNSDETFKSYKFINEDKHISALLYGIKLDNKTAFIYSNLEDISDFTILIKQQLMYVCIIGIFIAIIISIFLSSKITEPITKITKKAKKLGSGDTEVTFEESGIKEIDELSEALTQAQMEMVKTDELRRDLMANVSHDLKTPLTMIKAYAEMIRDISGDNKEKREKHTQVIIYESDRLSMLVNDILNLSKLQSSVDEPDVSEINLSELTERVIGRFSDYVEKEGYTIEDHIAPDLITVVDEKKIEQVIYNLLGNSINYTGEVKTAKVFLTAENDYILLEIIDSGKGISQEKIDTIWERYYRFSETNTRPVKGTGLGLSIVKAILDSHKLQYGVRSKKDCGSNFFVKFKRVKNNG